MGYLLRYPKNYIEGKKYPVLIFLHGAGTRGDDLDRCAANPFFATTEKHEDFPFAVFAPQCSKNTWFDMFETLERFVNNVVLTSPLADIGRVYLMGTSMGGYAAWQLAMSMPHVFAAIVPICGGGMYWNAARLAGVPVWAFHGGKDTVVFPEESKKMVDAVLAAKGEARLTIYPENGHNTWIDVYSDMAVFEWLLSKTNTDAVSQKDRYNNSSLYG